jgi:hypothetical protein
MHDVESAEVADGRNAGDAIDRETDFPLPQVVDGLAGEPIARSRALGELTW